MLPADEFRDQLRECKRRTSKPFGADPRGGPWASVIQRDEAFARRYAAELKRLDALQASARR